MSQWSQLKQDKFRGLASWQVGIEWNKPNLKTIIEIVAVEVEVTETGFVLTIRPPCGKERSKKQKKQKKQVIACSQETAEGDVCVVTGKWRKLWIMSDQIVRTRRPQTEV